MRSLRFGRGLMAAALASVTLLAAGCATETTYRPAMGHGFERAGYSERQIEPNRWLVMFAGNTVTPRDTVERYLLFRAAPLTLPTGNDFLVEVDPATSPQSRTYSTPGVGYGGFGRCGGYGRYGGFGGFGGFGYGGFGDPFFGGDIETVDRVEAEAQIVMRRGPVPTGNVRAFDARAVLRTLGPTIVVPKPKGGANAGYGPGYGTDLYGVGPGAPYGNGAGAAPYGGSNGATAPYNGTPGSVAPDGAGNAPQGAPSGTSY